MSKKNLFVTRKKAFDLRTKTITSATYTIRVGTVANDLVVDAVLNVATAPCAVALPDGVYLGQRVLINCFDSDLAGTVTVTAATGSGGDSTMATYGMYMFLEWVNDTVGWVVLSENVTG